VPLRLCTADAATAVNDTSTAAATAVAFSLATSATTTATNTAAAAVTDIAPPPPLRLPPPPLRAMGRGEGAGAFELCVAVMMVGTAPLHPQTISNAGPEGRWLLKTRSFETSFLKSMRGTLAASLQF